jgi:hypothetical protein
MFCGTLPEDLLGRKCCRSFCCHFKEAVACSTYLVCRTVCTNLEKPASPGHNLLASQPTQTSRIRARIFVSITAFVRKCLCIFARTTQPTLWCPFPLSYRYEYFSHPSPRCLAPALHSLNCILVPGYAVPKWLTAEVLPLRSSPLGGLQRVRITKSNYHFLKYTKLLF